MPVAIDYPAALALRQMALVQDELPKYLLAPEVSGFDSCSVFVGLAADKYDTEEDLAEELKLPDPYVAVRMNRLS